MFSQPNVHNQNWGVAKTASPILTAVPSNPAPYTGEIPTFYREECLVKDKGFIGYLRNIDVETGKAMFHTLELSTLQRMRAAAYIDLRDVYHRLYNQEAELKTEQREDREKLNKLYDDFVKKYGATYTDIDIILETARWNNFDAIYRNFLKNHSIDLL